MDPGIPQMSSLSWKPFQARYRSLSRMLQKRRSRGLQFGPITKMFIRRLIHRLSAGNPVKQAASSSSLSEGRLNRVAIPSRPTGLGNISIEDLSGELFARTYEGEFSNDHTIPIGCQIQDALTVALDVHHNRFSRRYHRDLWERYRDAFVMVGGGPLEPPRPRLNGATIVDLGCGSINPYGLLFLFLMLGARRGIAVDLDTFQDISRSARAIADCAGMMLIDPKQLVGDYPITREQVLLNIASFDLGKMNAGDPSGIDMERLIYRQERMAALSLRDGEADLGISNATLEHIDTLDDTIAEMARITRKGGFGVHFIDGADHRRYQDPACHPLEFLTTEGNETIVEGSNRIRPTEFGPMFERHEFEIISFTPYETVEVDTTLRKRLAEPFRSMPNEVLAVIGGKLVVRRL
jgi:SAM-dependent methyltransferase